MERLIVEGKVERKHPRGRSPTKWVDQVNRIMNKSFHKAEQLAQEREIWQELIRV